MRPDKVSSLGWVLVLAAGATISATGVMAWLALAETVVSQGILVVAGLLGIYLTAVVAASGLALIASDRLALAVPGPAGDWLVIPEVGVGLELVDRLPVAPLAPITIEVLGATGACPLGFRPGQNWVIDADGHISRPLCRPAVDALASLITSMSHGDLAHGVPCRCPLGKREVVYAVAGTG